MYGGAVLSRSVDQLRKAEETFQAEMTNNLGYAQLSPIPDNKHYPTDYFSYPTWKRGIWQNG